MDGRSQGSLGEPSDGDGEAVNLTPTEAERASEGGQPCLAPQARQGESGKGSPWTELGRQASCPPGPGVYLRVPAALCQWWGAALGGMAPASIVMNLKAHSCGLGQSCSPQLEAFAVHSSGCHRASGHRGQGFPSWGSEVGRGVEGCDLRIWKEVAAGAPGCHAPFQAWACCQASSLRPRFSAGSWL